MRTIAKLGDLKIFDSKQTFDNKQLRSPLKQIHRVVIDTLLSSIVEAFFSRANGYLAELCTLKRLGIVKYLQPLRTLTFSKSRMVRLGVIQDAKFGA